MYKKVSLKQLGYAYVFILQLVAERKIHNVPLHEKWDQYDICVILSPHYSVFNK